MSDTTKDNPGSPKDQFAYNNLLSKFQTLDKSNKNKNKNKKKQAKSPNAKLNNNVSNDETNSDNNNSVTENDENSNANNDNNDNIDNIDNNDNNNDNNNNDNINNDNDNDNDNDSNNNNNDNTDNNNNNNNNNDTLSQTIDEPIGITTIEVTSETGAISAVPSSLIDEELKEEASSNEQDTMAAADEENATRSIEEWLQDNKLYNSELLVVLKANHVDTEEDLKSFFEESDDIAGVIKSVRKRTEKQLGGFVKKVNDLTDLNFEYRAPRHRAKDQSSSNNANSPKNNSNALSSLNVKGPISPRNRSHSNSSQGSTGSVGSYTYKKHKGRPVQTQKEVQVEANAHNSNVLKQWLQRRNIFHKDLFQYLANHGYQTPDDLEVLTEKEFDRIVREVRVETFKDVDDAKKRRRVDKLLVKFEVEWRKLSGLRKTNMTKEQQEQWGYSPRTASQRAMDDADENNTFFSDEN